MVGSKQADAWVAMAVLTAAASSGSCAQIIGADWSRYVHGNGVGGAGGSGASGGTGGSNEHGSGSGGDSAEGSGTAGGDGGSAGGAECYATEEKCSEDTPQRCVDGRWEDAEPCPAAAPKCDAGKCVPPSCAELAETCGPGGDESCCATAEAVPGDTFNRGNDTRYPATVNGFLLDRFEVTVGRFRKFVEAYDEENGSRPAAGAGAHPTITGSGWDSSWDDSSLPTTAGALTARVKCSSSYQTWRDTDEGTEQLPMNCLDWYLAFAFCAWDGGRLATEAEWNYAAAGGREQRAYPWSNPANSTTNDDSHAVYNCTGDGSASDACTFSDIQAVGSRSPTGDGRWGQADLAGNMGEWVLDWYAVNYPNECNNCANMATAPSRVIRGGSFNFDASDLLSSDRGYHTPSGRYYDVGVRCARTP